MSELSVLELRVLRTVESFVAEGRPSDALFADLDAAEQLPANARAIFELTPPRPEVLMDCMLHKLVIAECGDSPDVITALNRLCNREFLRRIKVPVVPMLGPYRTADGRKISVWSYRLDNVPEIPATVVEIRESKVKVETPAIRPGAFRCFPKDSLVRCVLRDGVPFHLMSLDGEEDAYDVTLLAFDALHGPGETESPLVHEWNDDATEAATRSGGVGEGAANGQTPGGDVGVGGEVDEGDIGAAEAKGAPDPADKGIATPEACVRELPPVNAGDTTNLNDTEQNILEALGTIRLVGEKLAKAAGYPYNSTFKATLAGLVRHGILANRNDSSGRGYEWVKQSD